MTRIRQWVVTLAVTAVLALSFATVASADPGDPGGGFSKSSYSTASDPGDPGGGW